MQPGREALCNAVVFTPICEPSIGQGCANKHRLAFHLNGPGKADQRDGKALVENTGITFAG